MILAPGARVGHYVSATLLVELGVFFLAVYLNTCERRPPLSFWLMVGALPVAFLGGAFGPPPPDVTTLARSALALWLFVAWAWGVDPRMTAR